MTRSIHTLEKTVGDAVSSGGTITFAYPAGTHPADFTTEGTTMAIGGNIFPVSADYSVALGDVSITVTLQNGLSVPEGSLVRLGVSELDSPLDAELAIGNVKAVVVDKTASFTLSAAEKGAYIHCNSVSGILVSLPRDWRRSDTCIVRRVGAGSVTWSALTGGTIVLPTSRAAHTAIAEQHNEVKFRVISNADGVSAVWGIDGATA